jgi:hypothetical protein
MTEDSRFLRAFSQESGMEITTFEKSLTEETAIERTRNLSLKQYVLHRFSNRFDWLSTVTEPTVYVVYYPDYIAYTSVTIRRTLRGTESLKFLVGIDAVTGSVGEVDVELPHQRTVNIDPSWVIAPQIEASEVNDRWREWLFEYVSRHHRATAMPEYSLDELRLIHTPYWLIDYGTRTESLVVSDLTRRTAKVEEIEVIEAFYREYLSNGMQNTTHSSLVFI